jgi:hypothetical protein
MNNLQSEQKLLGPALKPEYLEANLLNICFSVYLIFYTTLSQWSLAISHNLSQSSKYSHSNCNYIIISLVTVPIVSSIHCPHHFPLPSAHPRVRFFLSHVGFNSLKEASFYGVPLLGMPFFLDQQRNTQLAVRNGWAIRVNRQTLMHSHKPLAEAFAEVSDNI